MPTVQHPRLPEVTRDVTGDELSNWLAQGWIEQSPTEPPEPQRDKAPARRKRT